MLDRPSWPGLTPSSCSPPARYTLSNQALKITEVEIFRCCGAVRCACCGVSTKQNNIDLNYIKDVDYNISKGCCAGAPPCLVK